MKKGLILALATVAITLLCAGGYAYAPIIGNIPDVWIGDSEDNAGTVDINFFRYSNAFNFDKYVSKNSNDEDQSTTNVRWSFLADNAALITINGINTISDPSESLQPDLVSKELTAYPNNNTDSGNGRDTSWATFYDLVDSPIGSGPPWPDPVSGSELDTIITVYASNGVKADSTTIAVRANLIDGIDKLSGGPEFIIRYDSPATQGFVKSLAVADGTFINAVDGAFYIASHSTSGGSVGASGHATQSQYGSWQSPDTDISLVSNSVYQAKYTIRTTQTNQANVPNTRLYVEAIGTGILAAAGGTRIGKGPSAPDVDGEIYTIYFAPPSTLSANVTNIRLKFEVIDFSTDEEGINYLDELEVYRFDNYAKSAGTQIVSWGPSFSGWTSIVLGSPFGTSTCASGASGLSIQTPGPYTTAAINWGMWTLGADASGVAYTADKLYRAIYTLAKGSASDALGKVRMYNANKTGDWSTLLEIDSANESDHMPTTSGVEYDMYFETIPVLYTGISITPPGSW
jgi:predicted secreted protein